MLRAGQGLTCFQEEFEVYTVDVPSSENFDGPKPILPHTTAYTITAHRFMSSLPGFTKSTCIRTSDGIAIIWFIKKGMTSPWGYLGQLLFKATVSALQALIEIYVLPRAIDGDLRHVWNFKEEVARHDAQNRPYGAFVSLMKVAGQNTSLMYFSVGPTGSIKYSQGPKYQQKRIHPWHAVTPHSSTTFSEPGECISSSASCSTPSI